MKAYIGGLSLYIKEKEKGRVVSYDYRAAQIREQAALDEETK